MSGDCNRLDGIDYRIIRALADSGMVIQKAANAIHRYPSFVRYRIDKIKRLTGLDPLNFWDLHKLVRKIEGVEADE